MKWLIAYRVAVVVLLTVIAIQLGAADTLMLQIKTAQRRLHSLDRQDESPAPAAGRGGLDAAYQEGTDRALQDMADRAASAPHRRTPK